SPRSARAADDGGSGEVPAARAAGRSARAGGARAAGHRGRRPGPGVGALRRPARRGGAALVRVRGGDEPRGARAAARGPERLAHGLGGDDVVSRRRVYIRGVGAYTPLGETWPETARELAAGRS